MNTGCHPNVANESGKEGCKAVFQTNSLDRGAEASLFFANGLSGVRACRDAWHETLFLPVLVAGAWFFCALGIDMGCDFHQNPRPFVAGVAS